MSGWNRAPLGIIFADFPRERGRLIDYDQDRVRRLAKHKPRQAAEQNNSERQFSSYGFAGALRRVPARHSRKSALVALTIASAAL